MGGKGCSGGQPQLGEGKMPSEELEALRLVATLSSQQACPEVNRPWEHIPFNFHMNSCKCMSFHHLNQTAVLPPALPIKAELCRTAQSCYSKSNPFPKLSKLREYLLPHLVALSQKRRGSSHHKTCASTLIFLTGRGSK